MKKEYAAPSIRELGKLAELTQQSFNKVGRASDVYSQLTNGVVVGSLTGLPTP